MVLQAELQNTILLKLLCFFPIFRKFRSPATPHTYLPSLSYFLLAIHIQKILHKENHRREELVVFIQQRTLGFLCLLGAFPSILVQFTPTALYLSRSTQLPRRHWKPLSGTQWASRQAATAQQNNGSFTCLKYLWNNHKSPGI